jgi:hypothetical protein
MYKPGFLIGLILVAGPAAAQDPKSYPPAQSATAEKFINAEVTKVDAASGLVTFRSESGDVLVTAGREVTANMTLRRGDKVLVAFRDVRDSSGFASRAVTAVRLSSPPAPAAKPAQSGVTAATTASAAGQPGAVRQAGTTAGAQAAETAPATEKAATANTPPAAPGAVVATGVGATSPYTNPVPSLNTAPPVVTAVLPPAGAKAPLTDAEVGAQRAQGLRDLDASAIALAAVANDLDSAWTRFKNQCLPGFTASGSSREWYAIADNKVPVPSDDTCRGMHTDLAGRVKTLRGQLDIVEEAARKADVLPAQIREVLDRHRLTR